MFVCVKQTEGWGGSLENIIKLHFEMSFQTYPNSKSTSQMKELGYLLSEIEWNISVLAKEITFFFCLVEKPGWSSV